MFLTKDFTASISADQIKSGNPIQIAYTLNDSTFPIQAYSGKSYQAILDPSIPVVTPAGYLADTEFNKRFVVPLLGSKYGYAAVGPGEYKVIAANGQYELIFQDDGNLVLYTKSGTILWASDTNHRGASSLVFQNNGAVKMVQQDGNTTPGTGTIYWGTRKQEGS